MRPAVLLTALCLLAACHKPEAPASVLASGPSVASRVKVLGGDVMVIDGLHVRLANAVAPQIVPGARCWAEALAAKLTMDVVKGQVLSARTIQVRPTGKPDDFGRTPAYVLLDGVDLGQTLFMQGAAAQPPDGRFRWCEGISVQQEGAPQVSTLLF